MTKELYRYWESVDADCFGYRVRITLTTFPVVRETTKSYIIKEFCSSRTRSVRKEGKNLFAFDTPSAALYNYRKRKERQLLLAKARLAEVNAIIEELNKTEDNHD